MKRDTDQKNNFSRRDFVKTTAVGVGATALAGLGAKAADAQQAPIRWDKVTDPERTGRRHSDGQCGENDQYQSQKGGRYRRRRL
ncbi:MAG: twin-arginine translocation signal domain-containing protein [Acidobacteria bacterium]|nr:twin-arginine translocation signal domain-containing protein [Acidobacteriota bacterium]